MPLRPGSISGTDAAAYKLNDGQTGYYRVRYADAENLRRLGVLVAAKGPAAGGPLGGSKRSLRPDRRRRGRPRRLSRLPRPLPGRRRLPAAGRHRRQPVPCPPVGRPGGGRPDRRPGRALVRGGARPHRLRPPAGRGPDHGHPARPAPLRCGPIRQPGSRGLCARNGSTTSDRAVRFTRTSCAASCRPAPGTATAAPSPGSTGGFKRPRANTSA